MGDTKTDNYLEYKTVIVCQYEIAANGDVTILQENRGVMKWLTQKLLSKPKTSQIHLDKMGNYIWPLMDGNRSIMDIAGMVKEHFGEEAEPLYDRLVQYIRTLESYGFISVNKE